MPVEHAARIEDEIAHGFGLAAMVGGALLGALAGVAVVAATAATGGLAAVVIAGAVAGGGLAGGQIMSGLNTIFDLPEPTTGVLAVGSPNVAVNKRAAIRAELSSASSCTGLPMNHPWWPASVTVQEGSATVRINGRPASRLKSKLMCGAHIKTASPDVRIGGETERTGFVFDLEAWTKTGAGDTRPCRLGGRGRAGGGGGGRGHGGVRRRRRFGFRRHGGRRPHRRRDRSGLPRSVAGRGRNGAGGGKSQAGAAGHGAQARAKTKSDLAEMMRRAPAAKEELDGIATGIADQVGGTVAKAPIKSQARALEKINNDYGGDAASIKDLARNTIVVPKERIPEATALLRERGVAIKEIAATPESLGYSGLNGTMKTGSGLTGEIQVNSPEMIYAKESPANARAILGNERYEEIAGRVGVPGGRGHALYEDYRSLRRTIPAAIRIREESMEYYDHVRGR